MKTPTRAQGHEGAFLGHLPQRGRGASPIYRECPDAAPTAPGKGHEEKGPSNSSEEITTPVLPQHPLDHPNVVKIALGRSASEALRAIGKHHLVMVSPADVTAPAWARDRMLLLCLPLDKQTADNAALVALGKMVAKPARKAASVNPQTI